MSLTYEPIILALSYTFHFYKTQEISRSYKIVLPHILTSMIYLLYNKQYIGKDDVLVQRHMHMLSLEMRLTKAYYQIP